MIATPTRERLVVVFERERARGPIEPEAIARLDALRPDLARSLMTAARLRLARAEAAGAALEALGLPALMIDGKGRVLAANALMKSGPGAVRWKARDGVAFADRAADRQLREALAGLAQSGHRGVRSFPVRDNESETPMIAHIVPVRLSARDILSRSDAALILTPLARLNAAPAELLQALFDLTPAEVTAGAQPRRGRAHRGNRPQDGRFGPHGARSPAQCARQDGLPSAGGARSPARRIAPRRRLEASHRRRRAYRV